MGDEGTRQVRVGDLVLDVRDGRPEAEERGAALLLHGFPQSSACWEQVGAGLRAAGWRTLAPDQRGYSPLAVPPDPAEYSLDLLVGDALAVLDDAGAQRAVVVGHDWGAVVAWALAAQHPDRVSALVAVSVPHPRAYAAAVATDADQRARSAYVQLFREPGRAEQALLDDGARRLRAVFDGSGLDAAQVDAYVAPLVADGGRRLTGALSWYRGAGADQMLAVGRVSAPTAYVWSDQDVAVGRAAADACAAQVTGPYRRVDLPGVSHWVPEQAPGAVVDAVAAVTTPAG